MKLKMIAAVLGLALAGAANAAITTSTGGNGELFFTVYDLGADLSSKADDRIYVRELGADLAAGGFLDNWATSAATPVLAANKQSVSTSYSLAADANLTSFLAGTDNTARLQWNIVAADSAGTDRFLTTATAATQMTYANFRNIAQAGVDGFLSGAIGQTNGSAIYTGDAAKSAQWGSNIGGKVPFSTTAGLGDSQNFFLLSEKVATGSTTTKTDVQQFQVNAATPMQWTLQNDGTLVYAAPVPEPETYALFLAGLGMLGAIARRRLAK